MLWLNSSVTRGYWARQRARFMVKYIIVNKNTTGGLQPMPAVLAIAFATFSCVYLYACYRKRIRLRIATKPRLLFHACSALYSLCARLSVAHVLALLFGLAGGILLIPNSLKARFVIGAVSFSIGHALYAYTFFRLTGAFSMAYALFVMFAAMLVYAAAIVWIAAGCSRMCGNISCISCCQPIFPSSRSLTWAFG